MRNEILNKTIQTKQYNLRGSKHMDIEIDYIIEKINVSMTIYKNVRYIYGPPLIYKAYVCKAKLSTNLCLML